MSHSSRALVILAAYDYEVLQLTLQSLEHTLSPTEKVVVILNGKRSPASEKVERAARVWASKNPDYRFAVRPLCSGSSAYFAITEVLKEYEPLKEVEYICKIDDDIIPLKKGWMDNLAQTYHTLAQTKNMGFVTSLINNNCWGFNELIRIYGKEEEYAKMFNYTHRAGDYGERKVPASKIDIGMGGTVWQYPYLAWWIHQWTSGNIPEFISKTSSLDIKQVDIDAHYSIGCIYLEKKFWLAMDPEKYDTWFDELLLHRMCKMHQKEKWAVMSEPMIHLFYRTHRHANADLVDQLMPVLADYFQDDQFRNIRRLSSQDFEVFAEDALKDLENKVSYLHKKVASLSFMKNWREKAKMKKMLNGG